MGRQTPTRRQNAHPKTGIEPGVLRPADPPIRTEERDQRKLRYELRLHPQVSDDLRTWRHLYERLGIILQQLAAHGRTSVVKGCRNHNIGWLRSPLGGHAGLQYYLWWAPGTSRQVEALRLPEQSIVVRAVRHHDEHTPLRAGKPRDYLTLTTNDELSEDVAGEPWTENQFKFTEDTSIVRVLQGQPGCGKTSALWQAVNARENENVLYLTWSGALARQSAEHFQSFAPPSVNIRTMDFTSLLAKLSGSDVERLTLETSRKRFQDKIETFRLDRPKSLNANAAPIHTEFRTEILGKARPWKQNDRTPDDYKRTSDTDYRGRRSGSGNLDGKTIRYILQIAKHLDGEAVRHIFPELWAAGEAWARLAAGEAPAELLQVDRIVVDEIQDLTVIELMVIAGLCKLIGTTSGRQPFLLMAGDTGQTVRPTGFSWAGLSKLIEQTLGSTPRMFPLDQHVRSPRRIAATVVNAAEHYITVDKALRPTKQYRQQHEEQLEGQLIHVAVESIQEANDLVRELAQGDDIAVLNAWWEKPKWLDPELESSVLTPDEAKGLEYQTVCILEAGPVLLALTNARINPDFQTIVQETHRSMVDGLRVGLSRATETLVLIDVQASDTIQLLSRALLNDPASYSSTDLVEHLNNESTPPEERVLARTQDARTLIDAAPERAWQRACQAAHLLGDPRLPNGIQDPRLRNDARRAVLETGARLLVTKVFENPEDNEDLTSRILREVEKASYPLPSAGETSDDEKDDGKPDKQAEQNARETLLQRIKRATIGSMQKVADKPKGNDEQRYTLQIEEQAIFDLTDWIEQRDPPLRVLESTRLVRMELPDADNWLQASIDTLSQTLSKELKAGAENAGWAPYYVKTDVEAWLRILGQTTEVDSTAQKLCETAFDTLIASSETEEDRHARNTALAGAERLLANVTNDTLRLGRFEEAIGNKKNAVDAYLIAEAHEDARRVWRSDAQWEQAEPGSAGAPAIDLKWLLDVTQLAKVRPDGLDKRLQPAEQDRLGNLSRTLAGTPKPKPKHG